MDTNLLNELFYPSESDEPIEWVTFPVTVAPPLTIPDFKFYLGYPPDVAVEEKNVKDFWQPVTTKEDWFEEAELETMKRFKQLKKAVNAELTHQQVFVVGRVEKELFLVGQHSEGQWAGLKTLIVET